MVFHDFLPFVLFVTFVVKTSAAFKGFHQWFPRNSP